MKLISLVGLVMMVSACKPYGDSKSDLGIMDSNAQQAGLVGTWSTGANGATITINANGSVNDSTCGNRGNVEYISQQVNCPSGDQTCGSATFTNAPFNAQTGCGSTQTICEFYTLSATSLQLSCSDSSTSFNYQLSKN